jgi:ParB family chromosome partitioning protein
MLMKKQWENLIDKYGMTQEEVAKQIGKSRSAICNTLRVLNLDPRVLEFVKQGKLVEGHCRALLSIQDPEKQYAMALKMVERGVTVRQAEHSMQKENPETKEQLQRKQVLYQDIENTFQNFFGTKVRLDAGRRKGKIIIEYSSSDDLERILNLMK